MSAVIFTACGGAQAPVGMPAPPQSAASAPVSDDAQPTAPSGKLRLLRGNYGVKPQLQTPFFDTIIIGEQNYRNVVDMEQAKQSFFCFKQDCPHGVPGCDAACMTTPDVSRVWAQTNEEILWLEGGDTMPCTIYRTDTNGASREVLFTVEGQAIEYQIMMSAQETIDKTGTYISPRVDEAGMLYGDDTALYMQLLTTKATPGAFPGYARSHEIWRVELATGEHTVLFESEPDTDSIGGTDFDRVIGCTDDALLLDIVAAPTIEEQEAVYPEIPALRHTVVELTLTGIPENAPLKTVYAYEENVRDNHVVIDNTLYLLNHAKNCVEAVDLTSGQARTLVTVLPEGKSAILQGYPDGELILSVVMSGNQAMQSYHIDKQSGALTSMKLQYMSNGGSRAVWPVAAYKNDYLVIYDEKQKEVISTGTDGTPYVFNSYTPQYALISKQDYYAGNPNYREIEMLPQ